MCERTGRAETPEQHLKDCIRCGCIVCRDYLAEFYTVTDDVPDSQQTLREF